MIKTYTYTQEYTTKSGEVKQYTCVHKKKLKGTPKGRGNKIFDEEFKQRVKDYMNNRISYAEGGRQFDISSYYVKKIMNE